MSNEKMEQQDMTAITPHNTTVGVQVEEPSTSDVHQLKVINSNM